MAEFLNFRSVEASGWSKEEVTSNVPFVVEKDITQSYKKWIAELGVEPSVDDLKKFQYKYLEKNGNKPGVGYVITLQNPVLDKKQHPYEITDVKNEQGRRIYTSVYQLIDDETGKVLADVEGTKPKAKELAKQLIINGFHGVGSCKFTKQVKQGENTAFRFRYVPSKNAQEGKWIVFGIERAFEAAE